MKWESLSSLAFREAPLKLKDLGGAFGGFVDTKWPETSG